MSKIGFLVCLVIAAMDVAAGILSIEAEIAQNKVMNERARTVGCREPSHDAFELGLAAAVLLALAHISGNLFGGCMCICFTEEFEKSSANRRLSFACLVSSWIVMAVGFPTLVIGALANSKSKESCGISRRNLLSVGGIFCFVHGILICMTYCVSAAASIGM
ncbi:hypothetical protein F0562_008845 [Nyssa sinensis]|uniref:Uncharacterized protein n=1 Tax=Nyssa sinensis TaxID=561372 RepID=A0A5J5AB10_9ASTE|nr:hypothetical protein F0562_008845 [Nyssa sinensis]